MEIPPAEIIDRYSILKLKIERIGKPELNYEYEKLKKAIDGFRREGIEIKQEWIDELYKINKQEWNLLEEMNKLRTRINNNPEQELGDEIKELYAKVGKLYLETERVNKKRSDVKNRVVEETGKGFKEIKKDHPSA